jgi:hypothetical protein
VTFARGGYAWWSRRPLHMLVFLAPLIAAYEIGSVWLMRRGEGVNPISAERILADVFDLFGGQTGLHFPAALIVVTLLIWHVLTRDPWRVRPRVVAAMAAESVAWAVPLLVVGVVVVRTLGVGAEPVAAASLAQAGVEDVGRLGRATIAIGAGVYEELLFRLVGITLIHLALVDLLGLRDLAGRVIALVVSSAAFALYHDVTDASGIAWGRVVYFFLAGAYFAMLFLARGFGIVVGAHAAYDLFVLLRPLGEGE